MDKQIEEVRQDLEDINGTDGIHILGYIPLAKNLIEKCYRKIPENAVVLTRKEYERLLKIEKDFNTVHYCFVEKSRVEVTRKETAEKFAELKTVWKQRAKEYTDWAGNKVQAVTLDWLFADIDETCKEFTEGEYGESLCEE